MAVSIRSTQSAIDAYEILGGDDFDSLKDAFRSIYVIWNLVYGHFCTCWNSRTRVILSLRHIPMWFLYHLGLRLRHQTHAPRLGERDRSLQAGISCSNLHASQHVCGNGTHRSCSIPWNQNEPRPPYPDLHSYRSTAVNPQLFKSHESRKEDLLRTSSPPRRHYLVAPHPPGAWRRGGG